MLEVSFNRSNVSVLSVEWKYCSLRWYIRFSDYDGYNLNEDEMNVISSKMIR